MSSYDLVIAKAKSFTNESVSELLREIADFNDSLAGVIIGINLADNPDDGTTSAYVMYEGTVSE